MDVCGALGRTSAVAGVVEDVVSSGALGLCH